MILWLLIQSMASGNSISERHFCHTWPWAALSTTALTSTRSSSASGCYNSTWGTDWPSNHSIQYWMQNGHWKRTYKKTRSLTIHLSTPAELVKKTQHLTVHEFYICSLQPWACCSIACKYKIQSFFTDFLSSWRKSKFVMVKIIRFSGVFSVG